MRASRALLLLVLAAAGLPAARAETVTDAARTVIAQSGGLYSDPRLGAYVASVGARIMRVAGAEAPGRWQFLVLDDPGLNAYAVPGGPILVTRGLVALAGDEAELAAVLAHEIGHALAGHGRVGSLAGGSEAERTADRIGLALLSRAGYAPGAQAAIQAKLVAAHRLGATASAAPVPPETGALTLRQAVSQLEAARLPAGEAGAARFRAAVDGMTFGPRGAGLRLALYRIAPGDDVAAMAAAMPARPGEFDLLNGLGPGDALRVGDWIKLVGR